MARDVLYKGWSSADTRTHAKSMLYRYLDTNGDGTGTKQAIGTYALAEEEFFIECPPGTTYVLTRMMIHYSDSGTLVVDTYGADITLTNGIRIEVQDADGNVILDLCDGELVTSNEGWLAMCYDFSVEAALGASKIFGARWTFEKSGTPIVLRPGQKFVLTFEDDFDDLLNHTFMVQGYKVS